MSEELINNIANVLSEWNPLGEKAESTPELEGYLYEAMDICSVVGILKEPVEQAVSGVLTQAFRIELNAQELKLYAAKIEQLINENK
ncbi:hypothetical protein NBRC116494_37800 [Aurantivibrio plasticivorans]